MFDVQVRRPDPPPEALESIAAYYGRVTTGARPMNRLVAAVMLATLAAIVVQLARGDGPAWVGWTSLALTGAAVGVAATRTVPAAVRLGAGKGTVREARGILREHLFCLAAIGAVLVLQLSRG